MTDQTLEHTETLVVHECPSCFVVHAIPRRMHRERLADGGNVYCPNGHTWVFTEPETARLKEKLRNTEQARDAARASATAARDQAAAAERRRAAAQGQVTKIRNRVGNGVCPCCKRTFDDLARHMGTKHPGYAGSSA